MQPSVFSQAVDETFPNLDEEARTEIKSRVFEHMIITMKDKIFAQDPEGHLQLLASLEEQDPEKKAEQYLIKIFKKFASMPAEDKTRVNKELEVELTRIMHELYVANE